MTTVACIVEGDGEVAALPVLLRRLADWIEPGNYLDVPQPIRVRRDRFINQDAEFNRMLSLASHKAGSDGLVLVVIDADDDCPVDLARQLMCRAASVVQDARVSVVIANREYESWFIASIDSLRGQRGIVTSDARPESDRIRDAKGWLSVRIPGGRYRERTDQPALSALMDLQEACDNSRSFRKLCDEIRRFGEQYSGNSN